MTRVLPALGLALAVTLLAGRAAPAVAATRYDPSLRFQTITTPHFVIYFHQGEERLARRLAELAEEVHTRLTGLFSAQTSRRTHVVLVDQTDVANGWASLFPYNTIEITAAAAPGRDLTANTADRLRMVFVHEYTHILHEDRSRGWAAVARRVFGRIPYAFPNAFLPRWQSEGFATLEETRHTDGGRVRAGDFTAIFTEGVRARRFEPLDRLNHFMVDWPSGHAPYVYGAFFHRYLAERYGEAALVRLAETTSGRFPYLAAPAFRRVFGKRLDELWSEFREHSISSTAATTGQRSTSVVVEPPSATAAMQVTRHGFIVRAPRWDRATPGRLLYSAQDPHGFPAVWQVSIENPRPRRVTTQYRGEHVAPGREVVIFDQLELARNVSLLSDLYGFRRAAGAAIAPRRIVRLTSGARLAEPDLAPDERTVACIAVQPGARALALVELGSQWPPDSISPTILLAEPDTQFAGPRWSPDGRLLVVERRRLHGPSEIVIVDPTARSARPLVAPASGRSVTPAWTPDGRTILFAHEPGDGRPFALYAVDLDDGATYSIHAPDGGAFWPDVSADGATIAYVGYTAAGYDIFTIPADRRSWTRVVDSRRSTIDSQESSVVSRESAVYSPLPTLLPRAWSPSVSYDDEQLRVGAATGGVDVLGRHAYGAGVWWNVEHARAEGAISYLYDRWQPTFSLGASDLVRTLRVGAIRRERKASVSMGRTFRRVRHGQSIFGAFVLEHATDRCLVPSRACGDLLQRSARRNAARFGWGYNSAKRYGYSVSAEEGVALALTSEHVRESFGAQGDADAYTGEARAYVRLGDRHAALAVRGGVGLASGDPGVRRIFTLGGAGPRETMLLFGHDSLSLLRGFSSGELAGRRVAVVNVDYRWPLVRIERGHGTWPFFARVVHASVFLDAGDAWSRRFTPGQVSASAGVELAVDTIVGYFAPLTFTVGAAWRQHGREPARSGPAAYFRLGRAF